MPATLSREKGSVCPCFTSINNDSSEADLACLNIDIECDYVNVVVAQYVTSLSRLLDKHAPLKKICIVDRPLSDWMTDDIRALKIIRRKN